ncbi:hypothetical protein DSO57_1016298 [Entomophthora muscae]|uniref:Uncharacterized protein n=1 Tax=Entomophthora muscae TaxID=34485 RepID=A0ACC2T520_9FUNG|nr:hypothetical protein DSO57_1016298 [Entomophthora muscae]
MKVLKCHYSMSTDIIALSSLPTDPFPSESPTAFIDGRLFFVRVQINSAKEANMEPACPYRHLLRPQSCVKALWLKISRYKLLKQLLISLARIQVWREKVTICTILLLLSSLFLFLAEGFPRIVCLNRSPFNAEKLKRTKFVLIHGEVIDLTKSASQLGNFSRKYPGQDITSAFPLYDFLARYNKSKTYPNPKINSCINRAQYADAWLRKTLEAPGYTIKARTMQSCPDPINPAASVPCFFKKEFRNEIKKNKVAGIGQHTLNININNRLLLF